MIKLKHSLLLLTLISPMAATSLEEATAPQNSSHNFEATLLKENKPTSCNKEEGLSLAQLNSLIQLDTVAQEHPLLISDTHLESINPLEETTSLSYSMPYKDATLEQARVFFTAKGEEIVLKVYNDCRDKAGMIALYKDYKLTCEKTNQKVFLEQPDNWPSIQKRLTHKVSEKLNIGSNFMGVFSIFTKNSHETEQTLAGYYSHWMPFSNDGNNAYSEVTIFISPKHQGKGLAQQALKDLTEKLTPYINKPVKALSVDNIESLANKQTKFIMDAYYGKPLDSFTFTEATFKGLIGIVEKDNAPSQKLFKRLSEENVFKYLKSFQEENPTDSSITEFDAYVQSTQPLENTESPLNYIKNLYE